MNRAKLGLTAGAFGVGLVTMAIAGFLVLSLGFIRMPNSNAIAPLPVEDTDALLSQDAVPHVAPTGNSGGLGEAIKVHGDWTIDVHNADGTLASHTEFENALTGLGSQRISDILARRMLPNYWRIELQANPLANASCLSSSNQARYCRITEPQGLTDSNVSNNLVVTSIIDGIDGILRLSGSIIAQRDGQITNVTTGHTGTPCAVGVTFPDDCTGSSRTEVTRTFITPTIEVSEGQIIAVTVEISFE